MVGEKGKGPIIMQTVNGENNISGSCFPVYGLQ